MALKGLQIPSRFCFTHKTRRISTSVRCNYIPDYGMPTPGNLGRSRAANIPHSGPRTNRFASVAFWDYKIPTSSVGAPGGYQLQAVSLPQYGPPGGNGNGGRGGGGGGWGGNGGSGDPMKGFTYLFAIFMFIAGIFAYFKRGSTKSLIVSTAAAALLLVAASMMGHPTSQSGALLAMATCASLAGIMGWRAKETGKLVPAGVVAALSAMLTIGYIVTMTT